MTTEKMGQAYPSTYSADIEKLRIYDGEDKVISSSVMRKEVDGRQNNAVRFKSMLGALDHWTGGFEGGELIALSGPTKNGKTLLAQTLTMKFIEQQIYSLWVSFEVPIGQFLTQIPKECEFFLPKILVPHRPTWLEDRIVESKIKFNTRAVFIDHLHYLIDLERGGRSISVDIGSVVRGLKRSAVKHNIVIFLLCHANKGLDVHGQARELGAMDLRDSSFISQEADTTWIIERKMDKETKEYNADASLKICNHRRTGAMNKRVDLEKKGLLFEAKPWNKPQPSITTSDGGDGHDSLPW